MRTLRPVILALLVTGAANGCGPTCLQKIPGAYVDIEPLALQDGCTIVASDWAELVPGDGDELVFTARDDLPAESFSIDCTKAFCDDEGRALNFGVASDTRRLPQRLAAADCPFATETSEVLVVYEPRPLGDHDCPNRDFVGFVVPLPDDGT
mgnify:CR=1 FL=1